MILICSLVLDASFQFVDIRPFCRLPLSSLPLRCPLLAVGASKVAPSHPSRVSGERCKLPQYCLGAKLYPSTITDDIWYVHCSTHMICPSMFIPASTELTKLFRSYWYLRLNLTMCVYFVSQKITSTFFGAPSANTRGHIPHLPYTPLLYISVSHLVCSSYMHPLSLR